ncbi:MAG: 4Fe-4S dicluster domain-containing protein [Ignavibacteriales bacterium]|nr:4Fe-4S dicluster domain-containing protein [Ignavibacteriales bacterium]
MQSLQHKAAELLGSNRASVVIGYAEGSDGRVRPHFARTNDDAKALVWDQRCKQNLAVYLTKHEIKEMGPAAIIASPAVVRTIVQMASEQQFVRSFPITLVVDNDQVTELNDGPSLEAFATSHPVLFPSHVTKEVEDLAAMSVADRFAFWQEEFSRCFKCYACRSACPLCYCTKCITESNQPQWVTVAPHALGNFEWHLNRAMHLAGRCIQCGSCTLACPAGIPIALLTIEASNIVQREFGYQPGIKADAPAALSSFRVEDKEAFIR